MRAGKLGASEGEVAEDESNDDFSRPSIKHLAFGLGVHRCLGSHLARMELRVVLAEWHRRIPSYRLPEGFAPTYSPAIREIAYLPLEFEPGVRAHVPVG